MNRARTLLKFSSPARALKKFTSPPRTYLEDYSTSDKIKIKYLGLCEPPGSAVTLCCTDPSTAEAYVLRYADGPKVHSIAFGLREAHRMTNSCNGLVGVYGLDSFWITNPSIPRVAALPRCSPHACRFFPNGKIHLDHSPYTAIGLADASTGEHKVVRIFVREWTGCYPISLGCEVLSLQKESRCFWKQVDDPPAYPIPSLSMPLVVDGIVYWTVRMPKGWKGRTLKIKSKFRRSVVALCFNLQEEKFSLLHHPNLQEAEEEDETPSSFSFLFLLEGCPCLVEYGGWGLEGWMTVWSLEDHATSEWIPRCQNFRYKSNRRYTPSIKMKVYYELPTMDYDDAETLRLLYNKLYDRHHESLFGVNPCHYNYVMDYRAPYTASNFWPF